MESKDALIALAALAQDTRLAIFRLLIEAGPDGLVAGDIGTELKVSAPTLSFHLKELSRAGLIAARQAGRFIHYRANFVTMNALLAFLTENCCMRSGNCCVTEPDAGLACAPEASRTGGVSR